MPASKYALLRYRIIHKLLSNKYHPFPDKETLRKQCEEALYGTAKGSMLSTKTIERDLRDMREDAVLGFYAPIKYCRKNKGYYYSDSSYSIDHKPLTEDEVEALTFAANTLYQFKDTGLFKHYSFAIEKIFEQMIIHDNGSDMLSENIVQFETVPYFRGVEHLKTIYNAIRQKKRIRFLHRRFDKDETTNRTIDPYILKEFQNRWYAVGFDLDKKRVQSFGLDRIENVKVIESSKQKEIKFDPNTFFQHSLGITIDNKKPIKITLDFNTFQGNYIKAKPLHSSQKILIDNKKQFRIQIEVLPTYELIQMILGYGPNITVIEPKELKRKVEHLLKETLKRYE